MCIRDRERWARQILSRILPDPKSDSALKKYLLGVRESFCRVFPDIKEKKMQRTSGGKKAILLSEVGTRKWLVKYF